MFQAHSSRGDAMLFCKARQSMALIFNKMTNCTLLGNSNSRHPDSRERAVCYRRVAEMAIFPCFSRNSSYIPRHLTRKHGSKGRPVAAGPLGSFAHTFPEEPTGELDDGTTRFLYASAA